MAPMMDELNAMIAKAGSTKIFTGDAESTASVGAHAPPASVATSEKTGETGTDERDQEEGRDPVDDGASIKTSSYYAGASSASATNDTPTAVPTPTGSDGSTRECDFDKDPTNLYMMVQERKWDAATERANACPLEAQTWVSRFETDGRLRWRLLPLHAAIIFRAPDRLVEALLCAYPVGAQCKDDQAMLPIHLAFRNGSSEGVVNLLLVAYPRSIEVKDRKGRVPLVLAQASSSANREAFIRAVERGPSYYAVAAAATERAAVTAEQRALFETKLMKAQREHDEEKERIRAEAEDEKKRVMEEKSAIQAELSKSTETSKILVEYVASLEAQLNSRSDTERFLALKIASLDKKLKEATSRKEKMELETASKLKGVDEENVRVKEENVTLKSELQEAKQRANAAETEAATVRRKAEEELSRANTAFSELEDDATKTRATALALEEQLKSKTKMEHSLANQVSELASRLAESAATATINSKAYSDQIEEIEGEKSELRAVVELLTTKLVAVSEALDDIAKDQNLIVDAAAAHERTVLASAEAQRSIVEEVIRQDISTQETTDERDQLISVLSKQAEKAEEMASQRRRLMEAVRSQVSEMESASQQREELMHSVERQRSKMNAVRTNHLDGLDEFVDHAMLLRARQRIDGVKAAASVAVAAVTTSKHKQVEEEDQATAAEEISPQAVKAELKTPEDDVLASREADKNDAAVEETMAEETAVSPDAATAEGTLAAEETAAEGTAPAEEAAPVVEATVTANGERFSFYIPSSSMDEISDEMGTEVVEKEKEETLEALEDSVLAARKLVAREAEDELVDDEVEETAPPGDANVRTDGEPFSYDTPSASVE